MREAGKAVCIASKSQFYTADRLYTVYKDDEGNLYVKGSDGIFDRMDKMVSKFIVIEGNSGGG